MDKLRQRASAFAYFLMSLYSLRRLLATPAKNRLKLTRDNNESMFILHSELLTCQAMNLLLCQRHANNLLIVAGVNAAVGEGRVRPDDIAAEGFVGRIEQMGRC